MWTCQQGCSLVPQLAHAPVVGSYGLCCLLTRMHQAGGLCRISLLLKTHRCLWLPRPGKSQHSNHPCSPPPQDLSGLEAASRHPPGSTAAAVPSAGPPEAGAALLGMDPEAPAITAGAAGAAVAPSVSSSETAYQEAREEPPPSGGAAIAPSAEARWEPTPAEGAGMGFMGSGAGAAGQHTGAEEGEELAAGSGDELAAELVADLAAEEAASKGGAATGSAATVPAAGGAGAGGEGEAEPTFEGLVEDFGHYMKASGCVWVAWCCVAGRQAGHMTRSAAYFELMPWCPLCASCFA